MSLELKKLDLHTHTPASYDFNDKTVTAEQIIDHAISIGLDAIAVTDHNTVDYIDTIKEAATKKGFTIFPGVEISCGGSSHGTIHVIALFDPTKTKDDLQKVLGTLGIKGKGEDSLTEKSVSDVVTLIRESGGLPILAHANSTHGALSDIRGNPRKELVRNKNLCAAEATASDFKKNEGERLIDFLNGDDPTYQRKLAVYKSSDNRSPDGNGHCLKAIGSNYTYFKMGVLNIESLRQCFEDPDSRIIQDYETEKIISEHPRIESIIISGGFLDGQRIDFHSGMNSIIGGTGTGKSLGLEFLRYVFDKKPTAVLFQDHKEKLQKQLGAGGEIKVIFKDQSGEIYEISRKCESQRDPYNSQIHCINKSTGKEFKGDISSLFPVLIYSQNEIIEITRDANAQLQLLDTFRDFSSYQNDAKEIIQKLARLDHQLFQTIQDSLNLKDLNKQFHTVEGKIKTVEKKLNKNVSKDISESYIELTNERSAIESKIDEFNDLLQRVDEIISEFENDKPTPKKNSKDSLDIIEGHLSESYSDLLSSLRKSRKNIEKQQSKSQNELIKWEKNKKYKQVVKKYEAAIKSQKKVEGKEAERKDLLKDKKSLSSKIDTAQKAAARYTSIRKERIELLTNLDSVKSAYFTERSMQADVITSKSGGKLQIIVQQSDNKETYIQMLKKLKVGSHAEKKEIEKIVTSITPNNLVEIVLNKDVKKLSQLAEITEQKADNIINELYSKENLLETLSLQHQAYPEDRVEISYQKKDNNYYPLSELSMGQKADALIMIALGDGIMPVIIDQPEDALDVPSIWTDICSRLRISKHARQFVFTTHNSSISVSSDSDQFIVLEADGIKGWIARTGSIDQTNIKEDVVGHLEGGYDSYQLKRRKYNL